MRLFEHPDFEQAIIRAVGSISARVDCAKRSSRRITSSPRCCASCYNT